jgi:hypothetical protein
MMDQGTVGKRGSSGFEIADDGNLVNNTANVERLRSLWLDRSVICGELLGPGDPGDFDHGAWHVACHLVAAGCAAAGRVRAVCVSDSDSCARPSAALAS